MPRGDFILIPCLSPHVTSSPQSGATNIKVTFERREKKFSFIECLWRQRTESFPNTNLAMSSQGLVRWDLALPRVPTRRD